MHRISNIAKEMIYSEIELKFENWKDNLQQMIDQKLQVDNMRVFPLNNDDPLPPQQTFSKDLPAYQTAEPQINYIESAKFINTPQINGSLRLRCFFTGSICYVQAHIRERLALN